MYVVWNIGLTQIQYVAKRSYSFTFCYNTKIALDVKCMW